MSRLERIVSPRIPRGVPEAEKEQVQEGQIELGLKDRIFNCPLWLSCMKSAQATLWAQTMAFALTSSVQHCVFYELDLQQ